MRTEMGNRIITWAVALALIAGIAGCVWLISTRSLSSTEGLLVSVVLTILSISGSWICSHHYAEASFNRNLRFFALKAAEKVTNLSNELDRLSVFLQQEAKHPSYDSPGEALQARDLRIEAAVHMIATLKSVNDRSLSDWQGVIGDEIDARREEQEEREEELRELVERLATLESADEDTDTGSAAEGALQAQLDAIKSDIHMLASQISGVPVRFPQRSRRESVERPCPVCGHSVQFKQRCKKGSRKSMSCRGCGIQLISRFSGAGFELSPRRLVQEAVACPLCGQEITVVLDEMPGCSITTACKNCQGSIRVSRTTAGASVRELPVPKSAATPPAQPLDEHLLERVRACLPPQPWPQGVSRTVAVQLGLSRATVRRAINDLTRRGVFKLQLDGRLYVPEHPKP